MDEEEGFEIISGGTSPFLNDQAYPFTIHGDNGEVFEMMAFPVAWKRKELAGGLPITTETRLIARQVLERQRP